MIKVYRENDERKNKICFHNTFLFYPHVCKDKISSNSFDEYLIFCENLRRENPSYLAPQFWEWLNTRSTEISVTSGRPHCSYNCVNGELKVIYLLIKFKKVMASKILKIKISQRKAGEKIKKRAHWSTKQTSILAKCLKEHSPKLESARASEFWNIIRDEVNRHSPEKTLKKCKDKIRNLRDRSKKAKEKDFCEDFDEIFPTRDIINILGFVEAGVSLPKEEGEDVSLGSEQSFTDKSSSDVNETPLGYLLNYLNILHVRKILWRL